jgi:S-adenosylmethionine synthetase
MFVMEDTYVLTSESVACGHPDKLCDQVSDAVLDAVLKNDPQGRVACETYVTMGLIIVGGEITTKSYVDIHDLVRGVVRDIGYTDPRYGFDHHTCAILTRSTASRRILPWEWTAAEPETRE